MKKNEPISKLLTTDVKTVHIGQKLSEVRKLLQDHSFHHVPVVSGDQLIGIISNTDMLALSYNAYGSDERSMDSVLDNQFSIEEVMQKDVVTITIDDNIRKAAEILSEGRFHSLPVVDSEKNLKGIVTSTDLIRYLLELY